VRRRVFLRRLLLAALTTLLLVQVAGGIRTLIRLSREAEVHTGIVGYEGIAWELVHIREEGGYVVRGVSPRSPADRVGLRHGDLITSVKGTSLREHPAAYFLATDAGEPGDAVGLRWTRDGVELSGTLILERPLAESRVSPARIPDAPRASRDAIESETASSPWLRYGPYLLPTILMLLVGAAIGFLRTRDTIAYLVALLLLVLGQALSIFVERTPTLALWPLWALMGSVALSRVAIYPLALLVVRVLSVFPNPSRAGRWLRKRKWILIPYAVLAVESIVEAARAIYGTHHLPDRFVAILDRVVPWQYLWLALIGIAVVLLVAQRSESRGGSRNRLGIVEAGLVGTLLGGIFVLYVWRTSWFWPLVASPEGPILSAVLSAVAVFLPVLLLSSLPLSLGYAVFAHRAFGIRLIIRRGIRYVLLSRGVLLAEGLLVFVMLGEAIRYGQREVSGSVLGVTAIAGAVSLLVVVALVRVNRPLLHGIDRRFFRESYDARRLLLDLSQQMLTLRERNEVLEQAGSVLSETLHPTRVGFFLRDGVTEGARLVWLTPQGDPAGGTASDAIRDGLSALADGGMWWSIPAGNVARAESERALVPFELLVALRGSTGLLGCVALGAKLSEEPYSGEDRELLATVATQMGFALENAELLEVAKREAEQSRELSLAREVQQRLFPGDLPEPDGWDFAAVCRPARHVGGDYYDLFAPDPGHVVFALGDVSGKGAGPALLMSAVHAIVRTRLRHAAGELTALVSELNGHLFALSSADMFMTFFVGVLDTASGRLRYVNAGHNPPLLFADTGGEAALLADGGTIVGMFPGALYGEGEVFLEPGGLLVLYSDGVTEAENQAGEMYGDGRLAGEISASRDEPESGVAPEASSILTHLVDSVDRFAGSAEQADDLTVVVVRRENARAA
jgi:sigma-B regulation protein RsbU (phosphoserine phosphatase)